MLILGIMGSPRKNGLTSQLVSRALEGADAGGAEVARVDLIDYEIPSYPRSRHQRYADLDELVSAADGMIIGSPVYYKDVTGLVREFIDYVHSGPKEHKMEGQPAFGICVAGGSGMGQITALRSLYGFFFFRNFRPIDPIPVSRFNFQAALQEAHDRGEQLAGISGPRRPFTELAERLAHFYCLRYLRYDMVDEIIMLAEQMLSSADKEQAILDRCRSALELAGSLRDQGRKEEAIAPASEVYQTLFH